MSDLIYSNGSIKKGKLTKEIQAIYQMNRPEVKEFHGKWGSLAVSKNLYKGFQPYETDNHICVVLGGPVLCFQDKNLDMSGNSGTQAIYTRLIENTMKWDDDLDGPFLIFFINKITCEIKCITDLMSFIPVYFFNDNNNSMLSTHVDVLARVSDNYDKIDKVSIVDFILHGIVTYPYTTYLNIKQLAPASKHILKQDKLGLLTESYWQPIEKMRFKSVKEAAKQLSLGLQSYVNNVVGEVPKVAHFISGGEDSRVLLGLMPKRPVRDAYIFLDSMNREGKVANKAAKTYGSNFNFVKRSKLHYLDILPACSDLVGNGSQYFHVHPYGFHKSCKLDKYSAVFGGFLSDTLLKGHYIKKVRFLEKFPFFPQIKKRGKYDTYASNRYVFTDEVLSELEKRREAHLNYIMNFRKESANEWFNLWPISMHNDLPNLHGNRRLFCSYEPFMSKEVVKISASVPQEWKLNRRLFQKAAKPLLKPSKWLFHSDGRLPYFPWYINSFVQFFTWLFRQVGRRTGLIKGNQGPWGDWSEVTKSSKWESFIDDFSDRIRMIDSVLVEKDVKKILGILSVSQSVTLLQVLYNNHKSHK